jgi:hypothetical protein
LWHDHFWFFVIHLGDEAFIRGVNETSVLNENYELDHARKKVVGLCSLISPTLKEGDTAIMQKVSFEGSAACRLGGRQNRSPHRVCCQIDLHQK